jgi:hypothetical protein
MGRKSRQFFPNWYFLPGRLTQVLGATHSKEWAHAMARNLQASTPLEKGDSLLYARILDSGANWGRSPRRLYEFE